MDGKQLKNSILQWAIQGKLVPQNPKDEPAQKLLERIAKARNEYSAVSVCHPERSAKGTKSKDLKKKTSKNPTSHIYRENGVWYEQIGTATPKDISDEIPFEIPENWALCRIKDICSKITDGTHHSPVNTPSGDYKYVTAKNIKDFGIQLSNISYVDKKIHEEIYARCNPNLGDILYIKDGATTGVCCINDLDEPFSLLSSVALLKPQKEIFAPYLLYCLRAPICYDSVRESMKGTGITRITLTKIEKWIIPLPPLAEQKRIVAKLEQVLPLAEEYGAAQEQLDKLNKELPEALKKSILQEAIQGKLVPHLKSDGQADEFLKKIAKEKESLINAGKIKKEKTSAPISDEEKPFDLPSGWSWIRLGDYCERVTDQVASGSFATLRENVKSLKTPNYAIMVKTADFSNNFSRNLTYTDKHGYEFLSNSNLFGGELILSNIGSIGKVFIVPQMDSPMTLAPNSVMLRLLDENCRDYLYYFLLSPFGYAELMSITSGTAMKKFNKTDLKTIVIPVPPLPEQKRIVKKIEELYKVIDSWH